MGASRQQLWFWDNSTQFETCAWVFCDGYDYEHRDVIQ